MLTITKKEVWETSDGVTHTSREMAHAYILNADICELFDHLENSAEPQDIVNTITSNAKAIREFLDACDAMERKVMGS
jgi:hypothetical protein